MKEALLPCRTCAVVFATGVDGEGAAQEHPTEPPCASQCSVKGADAKNHLY